MNKCLAIKSNMRLTPNDVLKLVANKTHILCGIALKLCQLEIKTPSSVLPVFIALATKLQLLLQDTQT